jgi:hypothetical protein
MIVFRAGGNDINAGKTPEQVADDFKTFVEKIHAKLPDTRIAYWPMTPSIARLKNWDRDKKGNELIKKYITSGKNMVYIDSAEATLGPDGKPRAELFKKDGLHFNEEAYKMFTAIIRPYLREGNVPGETIQPDALRAGLARMCITPEKPLWLHGYASKPRFRPSEGKHNDLYVKAMAIADARGERAVLITVDLCVIRGAEAKMLFDLLVKKTGLQRRQLLVNFSHTHSGPIIGTSDLDRYPMSQDEKQATLAYTTHIFDQITETAQAALADLKPATLAWGTGKCNFVRNRRLYNANGTYLKMGPNPDKPVDDVVPVLRVSSPEGQLRAIVFGCACHAVTFGPDNLKISGDYVSFAKEKIESDNPGIEAMFVQGCGADANSDPRCGPEAEKNVRLQGESLAAEVCRIMKGPLKPVRGPLKIKFSEVNLPLKPVPSPEELKKMSGVMVHNAKRMLTAIERGEPLPSHHKHPLALWQFGEDMFFVALSGEVVSGYVTLVKKALGADNLWIAGYSNEVDGYLPNATIVAEGGYEARGLVADIGFYSAEAEKTLVKAILDLRNQ